MGKLQNEFSWSKSRDGVFLECPRRYWFQYYGSWGGWEAAADPRTREIYVLKQIKSRQMWAGERVHAAIERTLKMLRASTRPLAVDVDEIVAITLEEMRLDYKSSRDGFYRKRPKSCALFEHEYGLEVPDEEWRALAATVERCLRTFYDSDVYARIAASRREDWLECEDFSSFQLDGVKVHVVLDFAMRDGDDILIYDWKTGASAERDNRIQMACYAFYAHQKWGVPPERVRPIEFNLNRGEQIPYSVTAADLDRTRAYMSGSISDMRRLLADPAANAADEAGFRKANELSTCRRCNFIGVCEPEVDGSLPRGRGPSGAAAQPARSAAQPT